MIAFAPQPILGAFKTGDLLDIGGGFFAVVYPSGSDTVLSIQRDGKYETRPKSNIGSWESFRRMGDKLVTNIEGNVYVIPIVEGV